MLHVEDDRAVTGPELVLSYAPLLKPHEVLKELRISRGLLDKLVRSGQLPAVRLGRALRFRRSDLDRLGAMT